MPLTLVSNGNTVQATDVNQIINVLQRPSGQSETGNYYIQGSSYASGARIAMYMRSTSQGATPASVSIDTTIVSPSNMGTPTTDQLTQYGFHIFGSSNAVNVDAKAAGAFTINY